MMEMRRLTVVLQLRAGRPVQREVAHFGAHPRVLALADTFDAMLSDRPYRKKLSLGEAAAQLSWLAPAKLDGEVVHSLLVQLRRDAVSLSSPPRPWATSAPETKTRKMFLDPAIACNISPTDIDHMVSELNRRMTRGRLTLA